MLPPSDDAAAQVRRELSLAAREALADTHARETRARRWIFAKRVACWLAIVGGSAVCAVGLVDVLRERGGTPLAVGGFFVADLGAAILVAPLLMRRWARHEKQRSVEKVFDDEKEGE